jgi:hypothetical protein
MNASHRALLLTSCISLTLHSMEKEAEQQTLTKSLTALQISNIAGDIQKLYHKTYKALATITSKDSSNAHHLLDIIDQTNSLKLQGITEYQMVEFAFDQKPSFENQFLNHIHAPYNGPHYVSAFFARLKKYNDALTKNKLVNPTIEDLVAYTNNRAVNTTIQDADPIGITFDIQPLKEQGTFKDISESVAIDKFHEFVAHIYAMRCLSPKKIEGIASLKIAEITPLLQGTADAKK